ncbi:HAD-IIB family hydrolase [Vagococcus salmoninarum]|nr:HAD family hydrolase [Vagococcus salmoninarum]
MNVVFDLDGTICYDGQTIATVLTDFLRTAIYRQPEHRLIFASARPVRDILPLLPAELSETYLIGGNGTMLYYQGKCQWLNYLAPADSQFLIKYIKEKNLDYLVDEAWDYALHGPSLAHLSSKIDVLKQGRKRDLDEIKDPIKILLANYPSQEQVLTDLQHLSVTCTCYPREKCLDFTNQGVNKASALKKLFGSEEYIAFGNDHNDVEMLRQGTVSVAIGDNQAIQEICDYHLSESPQAIIKLLKELLLPS